jgi:hypothetical protein
MSRRGGRRRNWILPGEARVFCAGRWGRRRARVEQCAATLTAEAIYGQLVCEGATFGPGSRMTVLWPPSALCGATWWIVVEVLANAVWRRGRMFRRCPACQQRATRLAARAPPMPGPDDPQVQSHVWVGADRGSSADVSLAPERRQRQERLREDRALSVPLPLHPSAVSE